MCLIAVAWNASARYPLALIANRDEFHARPAAAAGFDPDLADVYGGRDLQAGGSWLMVSTRQRLAAVTNVRDGLAAEAAPRSRGDLVRAFAAGDDTAAAFASRIAPQANAYGRFNLLLWDGAALVFAGNHPRFATHPVAPGVHAMSNGAFDAPWPKAAHATRALSAWLAANGNGERGGPADPAALFAALADRTRAPDALLPDTGVGIELERRLSPAFVEGDAYGTRCSSVVLVERDGGLGFHERRYGPGGLAAGESAVTLGPIDALRLP